ncbi:MAG TPA: hypothetical protein VMB85_10330 [Bryobacteraceae bacterium]|nr:hypothetical protein [Bryobacteraceae bacterium]
MKTKSAVKPSEIQRTVLNLGRPKLGVSTVKDATVRLFSGFTGE